MFQDVEFTNEIKGRVSETRLITINNLEPCYNIDPLMSRVQFNIQVKPEILSARERSKVRDQILNQSLRTVRSIKVFLTEMFT